MSISICDWEGIGDDEDTALNQQGDMIALKTCDGSIYRVYFNHHEDKAFLAFDPNTPAETRDMVLKIINAFGYTPTEIPEGN